MKKLLTLVFVVVLCTGLTAQSLSNIKGAFGGVTLKKSLEFSQANFAAGYLLNPTGEYYQAVGLSWDAKLGIVSVEFPLFFRLMSSQIFIAGSLDPFDLATNSGVVVRNPSIGGKLGGAYVTKKPIVQDIHLAISALFIYKTYFDAGAEAQAEPRPLAVDNLGSEFWFTIAALNIF